MSILFWTFYAYFRKSIFIVKRIKFYTYKIQQGVLQLNGQNYGYIFSILIKHDIFKK